MYPYNIFPYISYKIVNPLDMGVSAAPAPLATVLDMGFDIEPATAALNAPKSRI